MSLRPLATHLSAVSSLYAPYTTTGGGGGGGGPTVTTSTIVVSTITANGTIYDSLTGNPAQVPAWSVGVDNNNFAYEVLSGTANIGAYIDIRAESAPNTIVDYVRIQGYQGGGQIGYAPAPTASPEVGFRFFSSINGGGGGTFLVAPGDVFPLGGQLVPVLTATAPASGGSAPLTGAFSTIAGHSYSLDLHIEEEKVTGVPNAIDRMSYVVDGNVIDTHLHSEISTIDGTDPEGRMIHAVWTAQGTASQVTILNNTAAIQSTIVTPTTVGLNGALLRDLGPTNLIIAP